MSREQMERMRSEAERMQSQFREQGQEAMYSTQESAEKAKHNIASGLHKAAERAREQSAMRGQPGLASRVAEPLDRGAQYLETHSLPQMSEDAIEYARQHPFVTAAGVFTAAFLVGRLLRR